MAGAVSSVFGCPTGLYSGERCDLCSVWMIINFRRECDKARHKCIAEREHPIEEQSGAVQCQKCERWFYSAGGLVAVSTGHQYRQRSSDFVFCL